MRIPYWAESTRHNLFFSIDSGVQIDNQWLNSGSSLIYNSGISLHFGDEYGITPSRVRDGISSIDSNPRPPIGAN
jgi:hypothetical protein